MAQINTSKAVVMIFAIAAVFSVVGVSAQDGVMAPSPSPSMDAGSAFSLPMSGTVLLSALLISVFGFFKN
ncbi:hypothetical protein ACHQM5_027240 [Ranunculus cassubicifolius]